MHVIGVSLDFRYAPPEWRARLGLTAADVNARLTAFAAHPDCLSELVILATCERLECYAATPAESPAGLAAEVRCLMLTAHAHLAPTLDGVLRTYVDRDAACHLGRVAAGLESRVLGETQIAGQVSRAFATAQAHGAAGPALAALFAAATRAGKRARTETAISRHATSLSAVAVQAARRLVPNLAAAHVLVLGAGEMAALAVQALHRLPARHVTILNRTLPRAQTLAERWQVQAWPFDQLAAALAEADVVFAATAAPGVLLTRAQVAAAMQSRPTRPLLLLDLAVPPAIASEADALPHVTRLPLDALDVDRHNQLAARRAAIPPVAAIVEAEAEGFEHWRVGWGVRQVIGALRAQADTIRQAEVARTLRHLPNLSVAERRHVEALAEALLNRLLHEPTTRLQARAGGGRAADYSATVRDLFGLDGPGGPPSPEYPDV